MAQDIIADALNMIKNANRARKKNVKVRRISNLLIEILKIMKQMGVIERFKINVDEKSVDITIGKLIDCNAIKPRFSVKSEDIEKYRRRYLPARNLGTVIVSTNKGLLTHEEAQKEGIGGSLIAYFY